MAYPKLYISRHYQDTTSVTLTYALYLISKNPEIERICLNEINEAKSIMDTDNLWFCRAVILETLRLYPPGDITARSLQKEVEFKGGFVAPAGTMVSIAIWSIHRNEYNFTRPDEFLPERWVQRNDTTNKWEERNNYEDGNPDVPFGNKDAFPAFSTGGRPCPGRKFALQEAVIVLAGLLKDLKFSTAPEYQLVPERQGFVQGPRHGLPLTIELRS